MPPPVGRSVGYPFSRVGGTTRDRRHGRAYSGIYVASVYAKARTDNTRLFRQVWEAAVRVGNAPYFICMDANIDLNHSAFLVQMTRSGWSNVAEGVPDEHGPTYCTHKDWDRRTK